MAISTPGFLFKIKSFVSGTARTYSFLCASQETTCFLASGKGIWNSSDTRGAHVSSLVSPDITSWLAICVKKAKIRSSLEKLLIPLKRIMAKGFSSGKAGISWNIDENAFRRFCKIALVIGASSRSIRIFRTTSTCAREGLCRP